MSTVSSHTAAITFQTDIRLLAAIANWYHENGALPPNRNQLCHWIVRDMHQVLLDNGKIKPVETISEALAICLNLGLGNMQKSKQPSPAFVTGLKLETEQSTPTQPSEPLEASAIAEAMKMLQERKEQQ